jgi:hypothetical protein
VTLVFGGSWLTGGHTPTAHAAGPSSARPPAVGAQDFEALIFVWASGTPAVQRLAARDCASLALNAAQCGQISAATRAGWLDMAARDPSAVGRSGARPNQAGRAQALSALTASLTAATHGRLAALLRVTRATLAEISQPRWIAANTLAGASLPAGTVLVWATSYSQSSLPGRLNPKRSPYAALPDAYLKFADWGQIANIPSFYQAYYAPGGTTAHWVVTVANAQGTKTASNVPITDVGPWNEDDNWWDPNGSSTTLPASCPVASPPAFSDATSNALVDGICPTGSAGGNLRRTYYYLLYQHDGLPFFQSAGYQPSGAFSDGTAWPTALARYCSEAAAASSNANVVTCYSGALYNNGNGAWLRDNTFDSGITNQSSIDLSPAVDKALGWVYPSSGLVQVTVGALP